VDFSLLDDEAVDPYRLDHSSRWKSRFKAGLPGNCVSMLDAPERAQRCFAGDGIDFYQLSSSAAHRRMEDASTSGDRLDMS